MLFRHGGRNSRSRIQELLKSDKKFFEWFWNSSCRYQELNFNHPWGVYTWNHPCSGILGQELRNYWTYRSCWLIMGKMLSGDIDFIFYQNFVNLAGNKDSHNITDEFDFGPDQTIHFRVTRPWAMKNFPIDLLWKKCCQQDSAFTFDWIFFKFTGNQDSHKISGEFEFRPDPMLHFGVTCPWVPKNTIFDFV